MTRKTEALLVCFFSLTLIFLSIPASAGAQKIGYVDLQKCLTKSKQGKKSYDQLKAKRDSLQAKLDSEQSEIEGIKEQLQKQSVMLSAEAKVEKELEYQKKVRDFKNKVQDFNEEMKLEEEKHKAKVLSELADLIEKIGKSKGYSLILEKSNSGILWAPEEEELTELVIKQYDAQ